jgi:pSer/pThr/pTyr-binding forkhead associated (FHA) protein
VSEQLLNLLKLCLLALLYLFFLRVLRAVWVEVRSAGVAAPVAAPTGGGRQKEPKARPAAAARPRLVVVEPPAMRGTEYPLSDELTVGRAPGCAVTIDDTFVSQLHARVFVADGQFMVEDLGSTNGTFLNRRKVGPPEVLQPGDLLQVGNTVLELR